MTASPPPFTVPDALHEERLDRVLVAWLRDHSRSRLQRLVKAGRVTVDGEAVLRPSTPVPAGARLEVDLPPEEGPTTATGEEVRGLVVLHEDEHLAVIDKPAGLVTHPNERYRSGTVADLAAARWGPLPAVQGEDRPGIVHRLDRMTSGLLLLGLSEAGQEGLKRAFQERRVAKTYEALVHGEPRFDSEWIEAPIVREPRRERLRAGREGEGEGRPAATLVECAERFHGFAHVRCHPRTGRTHQIRVHLEHMGHPIVGDRLYGPRGALQVPLSPDAPPLLRQALHAARLALAHPVTGEALAFEAPLPEDVAGLLEWLRVHQPAR